MKTNKTFLLLAALLCQRVAAQNPIVPMGVYIADPSSRVAPDGQLYIYGSTDIDTRHYCSPIYHVLSSPDACQWTLHRNSFEWSETLYAPDVMLRNGTYYLYYDTPDGSEFVAVSKKPEGPFTDGVRIEGPRQIDPNIFIDDDGQAYYFWGQYSAKGAKMNPDMKTLDLSSVVEGVVTEKEHFFHEGSYVIKRGKYYYYIYADISRNRRPTCLGYAMATSPLGPYEYKGIIIDNAGCDPDVWNNHGSIVEFQGQWYVLYHRSTHNSHYMRKACIEPITFNADGTINEVEMTTQGAGSPLDATARIDAARACLLKGNVRVRRTAEDETREELGAIHSDDAAAWKYLNFGKGTRRFDIHLKSQKGGTVLVHVDAPDGKIVGEVNVPAGNGWQTISTKIQKTKGIHAVWFEFKGDNVSGDDELFRIDWFRFARS